MNMKCSFPTCELDAVYEHRYVKDLYFCEAHKYVHVTLNNMSKKMGNKVMVKIDEVEE